MRLVDTHCHLQDEAFAGEAAAAIERAVAAGVTRLVVCGYDAASNAVALELAAKHPAVAATVGFHPHDAADVTGDALAVLEATARSGAVVAIGEIGLDFYRDRSPRDVQLRALEAQLAIAARCGLPVSVHTRGAEDAIREPLAAFSRDVRGAFDGRPIGVMHCFGGTLEQALGFVELGFVISFACAITYPRNDEARRMAAGLPAGSFVVETDSPYLPPQAVRGKRNEPAHVMAAVEAIALARHESVEAIAAETTETADRLFRLGILQEAGAW